LAAFRIAAEGDPELKRRAKDAVSSFTAIRHTDEFQQLIADAPEYPEPSGESRKMSELEDRLPEIIEKSFVIVEVAGTVFAGAVLDRSGYILTVAEVTKHPDIRVIFGNHNVPAQVVTKDEELNFAILKIDGYRYLRPIGIGNSDVLKKHKSLPRVFFGNRSALESCSGTVLEIDRDKNGTVQSFKLLAVGRYSNAFGNILLNIDGEVVGICVFYEVIGLMSHTPTQRVLPINIVMRKLEETGVTKRFVK